MWKKNPVVKENNFTFDIIGVEMIKYILDLITLLFLFQEIASAKRLYRNYFFCHSGQAKRDDEPAPYLIRGNPVLLLYLVPDFRRDDVWIYPKGHFAGFRRYDDFEAVFSYCDTVSKWGLTRL
jgi:hypothetical protein